MKGRYILVILIMVVVLSILLYYISFKKENIEGNFNVLSNNFLNETYLNKTGRNADKTSKDYKVYSEVWSQNSPYGSSYEFKVNCFGEYENLETCFLYDLDEVLVINPENKSFDLKKDFNINSYSGEITRRWVLYGPYNGSLPKNGKYIFRFIKNGSILLEDNLNYSTNIIDYPKNIQWLRRGNDLEVKWSSPYGINDNVNYKVIVWEESGTPDLFISKQSNWNESDVTMQDVPLINGGNYSLNVAIYFKEGYAFSEYIKFRW